MEKSSGVVCNCSAFSTEESWSDNDVDTRTSISESSTPNAFREDRYPSDASDSVSDDDSIVITHMQML